MTIEDLVSYCDEVWDLAMEKTTYEDVCFLYAKGLGALELFNEFCLDELSSEEKTVLLEYQEIFIGYFEYIKKRREENSRIQED